MRVITVNVNSIRAVARKGLFAWLSRQRADVVCVHAPLTIDYELES